MGTLETVSRVTVFADELLRESLLKQCMGLGAKGYTVIACSGKGAHETVADPWGGASRVRIEMIVQPAVAEAILNHLASPQFRHRAVAACADSVQVAGGEKF